MTSLSNCGSASSLSGMDGKSPFLSVCYRKAPINNNNNNTAVTTNINNENTHDYDFPDEETPLTSSTSQGSSDHPKQKQKHKPTTKDDHRNNNNKNSNSNKEPLSWTLLVTVFVVTLGSSLQFGYGKYEIATWLFLPPYFSSTHQTSK